MTQDLATQALAAPQHIGHRPSPELADLRDAAMRLPLEEIAGLLANYKDRRNTFREWLMKQLVLGVHYGVPPGCEPKGNVRPEQWRHKPSLYKAGAEFVCDLMNVRARYTADLDASQQLGEAKPNSKGEASKYFVYKCELVSRSTGEVVGEGTGARRLGDKGGDVNNSVKMAQKNAMVAAVLNSYSLSDLFTQDFEPPQYDNPEQAAGAAQARPRGERITGKMLNAELQRWLSYVSPEGTMDEWAEWVRGVTKRNECFERPAVWNMDDMKAVSAALDKAGPR